MQEKSQISAIYLVESRRCRGTVYKQKDANVRPSNILAPSLIASRAKARCKV